MSSTQNWTLDNLSFIIGTSLGVLGIFIGLVTYWLSRQPKTIDYFIIKSRDITVVNSRQLRQFPRQPEARIALSWHGIDGSEIIVQRPRIRVLRIKNTGKKEITSDDFVEPIRIHIPIGERIIESTITSVSHSRIHPLGVISSGYIGRTQSYIRQTQPYSTPVSIEFRPFLLNAGDWIEIQLVTDLPYGMDGVKIGNVTVDSWIKGQSRHASRRRLRK